MAVLVTCATGFVSRAFVRALAADGQRVRVLIRDQARASEFSDQYVVVGDVFDSSCIKRAVREVETIIHVPPLTHPGSGAGAERAMHRRMHVDSTRLLLNEAVAAGVRKFLFVSSAHATGRNPDRVLCESSGSVPTTPYGQAKLEAEELLRSYAERHSLQVVILRPPTIYGPGDKSIVTGLRRAAERNLWLPLKGLDARHSLVFVDTLARAGLALLKVRGNGTGVGVFIVKDSADYGARELYAAVCRSLRKGNKSFWVPPPLLKALGRVGVRLKNVPLLHHLGLLDHLLTPQRYCGHLFAETLPDFPFVGLDEALQVSFGKAGSAATFLASFRVRAEVV